MLEEENYLTRPKIRVDTLVPRQFITIPAYTKVPIYNKNRGPNREHNLN